VLEAAPNSQVLRFGTYEVDLRLGELRKNGIRVKLTGQPFQILVILLEHPGDLVTREQLQRRLWPSDTFVDFDRGLNAAINRVREALGDSAENPRFVETLPRRGYRFIAPLVDPRPTSATLPIAESNVTPAETVISVGALPVSEARERRPVSRRIKLLVVGGSVLAVLVVAAVLLSKPKRRGVEWDFRGMKLSRVTQSGNAINVAISPDGRYVAYALREGEKQSLHVRQVATGSDVQIVPPDEVRIYSLTFTPDANYIDFIRSEKPNFSDTFLYRVPALGGTPHLVMPEGIDFGSSYSPDATRFAFFRVRGGGNVDVLIANADGSDQRVLASRPYRDDLGTGIAWSPDGKTIAFTTSEATKRVRSVLWVLSITDGSVREIYSTPDEVGRPRWLPDGSGLLAPISNVDQASRGQLWFISYPKGNARRLTNDLMDYQLCCLDLTPDGKTLVDTELATVSDLWIASAGNTEHAKQITNKEFAVGGFSWMPNGRIILASLDGNLFAVNPDGSGRTLLTPEHRISWDHLPGRDLQLADPSVCGDGRYIVYAAYSEQKRGIWRMDVNGSHPIRIADETFAISPQCSPDGKWVVYLRGPSWNLVKASITGAKPPEVLAQGGDSLRISPNGKRILYLASPDLPENPDSPPESHPYQLKVIPFDGGVASYHVAWPVSAQVARWTPAGDAVEYALTRNGVSNIWRQKLAGGGPKQITNFESGLIFDFEWSHDGRQLALRRGTESSDVILMSNLR